LVLLASAAGLHGAAAQSIGRAPSMIGPGPINPGIALPRAGQSVSGLDAQELGAYSNQLQSQIDQNRLSGADLTLGGARSTRNLDSAVGRVNGAINGR
jgi:hypothetical protein